MQYITKAGIDACLFYVALLLVALAKKILHATTAMLTKYPSWRFVVLAHALVVAPAGWAAAITITATQELVFGKIAPVSGGAVTISTGGARSASGERGGVILLPTGAGSAAQFVISGDANASYVISLPNNGAVLLTSGAHTMAVSNFTSSTQLLGTIGTARAQTVFVGATLNVGSNQAAGSYSGAFSVSVNYN